MSGVARKIFVMGGGGFAMEPGNPLLDLHVLSLVDRPRPRICFIGTASGDSEWYVERFHAAYGALDCRPSHLSLFKPSTRDLAGFLAEQDVVHVGGGNTKNLLCLWRDWGLDAILRDAYARGLVLTGLSAGMICWFEHGTTDSFGGLDPLACLGWLPGSASPHFDGEPERRPAFVRLIREGAIPGGIGLDDGVGALYVNEELAECVSSRPRAGAWRFASATAEEEKLPVRYLGG